MSTAVPSLEHPIEERIAWAVTCFQEQGAALLADEDISALVSRLRDAEELSRRELVEAGVAEACRACEEREGGSCCGSGLENHYSSTLLLINLLLGADIFHQRQDPSSCLFLGKSGCRLLARHVICINYLCRKAEDRADPRKISSLREKEGVEAHVIFLLHERVKMVLEPLAPPSRDLSSHRVPAIS